MPENSLALEAARSRLRYWQEVSTRAAHSGDEVVAEKAGEFVAQYEALIGDMVAKAAPAG